MKYIYRIIDFLDGLLVRHLVIMVNTPAEFITSVNMLIRSHVVVAVVLHDLNSS